MHGQGTRLRAIDGLEPFNCASADRFFMTLAKICGSIYPALEDESVLITISPHFTLDQNLKMQITSTLDGKVAT